MASPHEDVPGSLLRAIYAVIEDRRLWPEALRLVAGYANSTYASIMTVQFEPRLMSRFVVWGVEPEELLDYYQRLGAGNNPWITTRDPSTAPVGLVVDSSEVCPDEILEATPAYEHFLKPRNLHYGAAGVLLANTRATAMLGLLRPKSAGRLNAAELDRVRAVTPHLHRALRIQEEQDLLAADSDSLRALFEQSSLGLILLDANRRILLANTRARLNLSAGTALVERDGRLHTSSASTDRALRAAVQACLTHGTVPDGLSLDGVAPGGSALRLAFSVVQQASTAAAVLLVHVLDTSATPMVAPELLRKLFSFSAAEASVAACLAGGVSLADTATRLHLSPHTVRSHVKNLFLKTGTHQQSALVSAVLRLHPLLAVSRET